MADAPIKKIAKPTIEFVKDSVQNSKIGGTKNNDYFQTFNDDSKSIMKKAIKFQNENQKVYMEAMQGKKVGQTIKVGILRQGKAMELDVKLE